MSDNGYETVPVYGTADQIGVIIQELEDVEMTDHGMDINGDFVVELKIPSEKVESMLPLINQGEDDLGAIANGVFTSFKERR